MESIDRDIIAAFFTEVAPQIEGLHQALLVVEQSLEEAEDAEEVADELLPVLRRVKKSSGTLGFSRVEALAYGLELFVEEVRTGQRSMGPEVVGILYQGVESLAGLLEELMTGEETVAVDRFLELLRLPEEKPTRDVFTDELLPSEPLRVDVQRAVEAIRDCSLAEQAEAEVSHSPVALRTSSERSAYARSLPEPGPYLIFSLHGTLCGTPVQHLSEVLPWSPITPLPQAPSSVVGVLTYGDKIIPILSLRDAFSHPPVDPTTETRILIFDSFYEGESGPLGAVVDSVRGIVPLERAQLLPRPWVLNEGQRSPVLGLAKIEDGLVILVDLARGLSPLSPSAPLRTPQN